MADLPTKINLTVVTRERRLIDVEVDEVVLPGANGELGILPGHTPLLATLRIGALRYRQGSTMHRMVLSWGFAEVLPDRVIVLAERGVLPGEINAADAEADRVAAEKELAVLASHDPGFAAAEARLEESIAMIGVSREH
ncbi:MAG TPA: ATP synthase F1 subunit epsilon [Thermoanaerobaculia bacterium]|jgi:F-type H+-transporting ATPase subunit epsilon